MRPLDRRDPAQALEVGASAPSTGSSSAASGVSARLPALASSAEAAKARKARSAATPRPPEPESLAGQFEMPYGPFGPPTLFPIPVLRYMKTYGLKDEDLATVAATLQGRRAAPGVVLTVTPGSRQILDTIIRSGVYGDLFAAGARMLEPVCGPCVGIGQAPVKGRPSLRTFNRNFPGRSGTQDDAVYLCSPSTAAASAMA